MIVRYIYISIVSHLAYQYYVLKYNKRVTSNSGIQHESYTMREDYFKTKSDRFYLEIAEYILLPIQINRYVVTYLNKVEIIVPLYNS